MQSKKFSIFRFSSQKNNKRSKKMKKIFLIDAMAMIFRAFHAMYKAELTTPQGIPSGAVYGFTNILTKLLETEKPENLAVIFDRSEPTFRHIMYDLYKANRTEFPEELIPQIPLIKELLDYLNIPYYDKIGLEADDIIGTLATRASKEGIKVFCITSDKDFMQLVDDNIKLLKPSRKGDDLELISYDEVKDKFGVRPNQVIEVQALIGDSVDNIPGVKGVGEKTAIPLIQDYENLEGLYENIEKVTKKAAKTKLINDKDMAFLSRKLVTLEIDADIDFSIGDTKISTPDYKKLDDFFLEMGFRTIRQKWQNKAINDLPKNKNNSISNDESISMEFSVELDSNVNEKMKTIDDIDKSYKLIDDENQLDGLIKYLSNQKLISFDLETSSLDTMMCDIVGIALAVKENEAFYIATYGNVNQPDEKDNLFGNIENKVKFKSINIKTAIEKLRPILENKKIDKIGQNCKFDMMILKRFGILVNPISFDTMLASYILNPDNKHGMDALSERLLNYKPVPISSIIGEKSKSKKNVQKTMLDFEPKDIKDYACEDADVTLKLKNKLEKQLEEEKLTKLAKEIEFPMVSVLTDIESNGVAIDKEALSKLSTRISKKVIKLQEEIFDESQINFNIDSPKQVGHILFEKMMLPSSKKTKSGFSTDVNVLQDLAKTYPIAEYILEYRGLKKLKSTYVDVLPKLINPNTNRIHTTFNQTVASTGRLSSNNPNLQNIPIRTELGKEVRKAFIPGNSDSVILSADYSQIELRIMAYICEDEHLISSFKQGLDIHAATSAKIFGKDINDVTQDDRRIAKTVNFGIMYGLGVFGLAQRLNIKRAFAKEVIENYFESYPGIRKYIEDTKEKVREKGYAETLSHRRRYFKNINASNSLLRNNDERAAINMPIQGTASDMLKIAMINIHKEMQKRKMKSLMTLQVHDELVFEVKNSELEEMRELVVSLMSSAMPLGDVPVLVESGTGLNWFEAH